MGMLHLSIMSSSAYILFFIFTTPEGHVKSGEPDTCRLILLLVLGLLMEKSLLRTAGG
jgi:hypothetical protein